VVTDLETILRAGLPVRPTTAGSALLSLRGAWARAVDPQSELARVDALDRLLRQQLRKIRQLGHRDLADAPQVLFGIGDGAGLNLTNRRARAAVKAGYETHHFRKRIEPVVLEQLAWLLHQDSLQYAPRARSVPPAAPSGDTPAITEADVGDPERAEHEILLSRIWSGVYALRADLITCEQYRDRPEAAGQFKEAQQRSRATLGNLLLNLDGYLERWGERILHGEAEYRAESLVRLAGWRGDLTQEEARQLRWEASRARGTD
jgi:hypothetical protein